MAEMLHKVVIRAEAQRVYDAIATESGLRGWWTEDSTFHPEVGGKASFGFGNRGAVFSMLIEELAPPRRVVWRCTGGHHEWEGTRLIWEVKPATVDKTKVRFTHAGWRSREGWYATCNTTWGALMQHLKMYVEGHCREPFFVG